MIHYQDMLKRVQRVVELCIKSHANNPKARDNLIVLLNGGPKERLKACLLAELESNEEGKFLAPTDEWVEPKDFVIGHVVPKAQNGVYEYFNLGAITTHHNVIMGDHTHLQTAAAQIKDREVKSTPDPTPAKVSEERTEGHRPPQTPKEIERQKHAENRYQETEIAYWERRMRGFCAENSPVCEGFIGYDRKAYCAACLERIYERVRKSRETSQDTEPLPDQE